MKVYIVYCHDATDDFCPMAHLICDVFDNKQAAMERCKFLNKQYAHGVDVQTLNQYPDDTELADDCCEYEYYAVYEFEIQGSI